MTTQVRRLQVRHWSLHCTACRQGADLQDDLSFTSNASFRCDIEEAYLGKELDGHRLAFVEVGVGDYRHQGLKRLQQGSWVQHGLS